MTTQQFNALWKTAYPDTVPIPRFFKHADPDRWFRIQSLPDSKRFAETPEEWEVLLERYSKIFTDLIGERAPMLMVSGEYYFKGITDADPLKVAECARHIAFVKLDPIDMHKLKPDKYLKGEMYKPMFSEQHFDGAAFEPIVKGMAAEELIAYFISVGNECLVAPGDGGIDIIVKDAAIRDVCRAKYKSWLSAKG
jgi:hypothetical protein